MGNWLDLAIQELSTTAADEDGEAAALSPPSAGEIKLFSALASISATRASHHSSVFWQDVKQGLLAGAACLQQDDLHAKSVGLLRNILRRARVQGEPVRHLPTVCNWPFATWATWVMPRAS